MNPYFDQIFKYFEAVPLWPFLLLGIVGIVAVFVEILNRKRRAAAIDNFRYTIETEFSGMYPKPLNWPENVGIFLCERLPEMQQNFNELRGFIPQDRLLSYNTVWNNYCDFCRNISDEECAKAQSPDNNEPDPRDIFHELVTGLLEQTKIT